MTINLPDENLIPGTVAVRSDEDGTDYNQITDYRVDHQRGEIIPVDSGAIVDGEALQISYSYKPTGRFESAAFSGDPVADERIDEPSLTTASACRQRAKRIVESDSGATLSARVDLSALDPGTSTLRALGTSAFPRGIGPLPVVDIEQRLPAGATLRLGDDESVEDRHDQLDQRDQSSERRV